MKILTLEEAFENKNFNVLKKSLEHFAKKSLYDKRFWKASLNNLDNKESLNNWKELNYEAFKLAYLNPVKSIKFE